MAFMNFHGCSISSLAIRKKKDSVSVIGRQALAFLTWVKTEDHNI